MLRIESGSEKGLGCKWVFVSWRVLWGKGTIGPEIEYGVEFEFGFGVDFEIVFVIGTGIVIVID